MIIRNIFRKLDYHDYFFFLQSNRWLNGTLLKMKVLYLNFTKFVKFKYKTFINLIKNVAQTVLQNYSIIKTLLPKRFLMILISLYLQSRKLCFH